MRKKRVSIIIVCIIILILICTLIISKDNKEFVQDGIRYAILVDGKSVNSFPEKGLYHVEAKCINATCKWDYDAWKLYVEDIKESVQASVYFTKIEKNYLKDTIMSLSDLEQGNGKLINEKHSIPSFEGSSNLTQNEYKSNSQFSATSSSATSGTEVSDAFKFNDNEWNTNISSMTKNMYYNLSFTVPSNGDYQICYQATSGSTGSSTLYVYNDNVHLGSVRVSYSNKNSTCIYLGRFGSETKLQISYYVPNNSDVATSFAFQKSANINTISDYRYEGKNPNNYIQFNDEIWRIIGVSEEKVSDGTAKTLTKIIRSESIGTLVWNKYPDSTQSWSSAPLKYLLNNSYYNQQDGTSSSYCYEDHDVVKSNCDYTKIGINATYRPMIKNVTWNLGGWNRPNSTTDELYAYERSVSKTVTGYIGLMYPSDYGYSMVSSNCDRATKINKYNTQSCAGESWLYGKGGSEWTMLTGTGAAYQVFRLYEEGNLHTQNAYGGLQVRPTLYLNENVYVLDGNGSEADPYIIGM